ncbi:3'-5' exonuclease [Nitrincola sp. MINF-07-Sa-05]|uniref:3'-5' exonuclease n=1 Tax=Nitrincola salilacus TaxID=3400273 RepID=UPI003917C692
MLYLGPDRKSPQAVSTPDWPSHLADLATRAKDPRLQRFYQAGAISADTPLAEVPFVALDFETTGLDSAKHGIISIGLVPFSLQRIRCSEAQHWLINPRKHLEEESIIVHGITHSDISNAPDLDSILADLLDALAGRIVVVHYRQIERPFLDTALKARLGEGIEFPVVDTLELEARLHRNRQAIFIDKLLRRPHTSIRLADSRTRYHLPYYQQHHALTDALATAELLQAQVAHRFSPDTPIGELWV